MSAVTALTELLERMGLGPSGSGLEERLAFLDWELRDGERLRAVAPELVQATQAFIDELYERLLCFPAPAAILVDNVLVGRLKSSQQAYYHRLFDGHIDPAYLRERVQIGQVHERVGVGLKWYLGGYRLFLSRMLNVLSGVDSALSRQQIDAFDSLLKIVFFDMGLAAESYLAAEHRALEASEARYSHALRGANDGIWDWDAEQDLLYVSSRWADMLGLTPIQVGSSLEGWMQRVHPLDRGELREAIDRHLGGTLPWLHCEYRIRRADDTYLWVLTRGVMEHDADGNRHLAGSQTDVSERRSIQAQLEYSAGHDALTGLINRQQLDRQLYDLGQRLDLPGARCAALLFIDLDRFKLINDSLGHAMGDRVLIEVAQRLLQCMRRSDQLARFGGDEFVMLLEDLTSPADADEVAARVLSAMREPLAINDRSLMVSVSIGVAPIRAGQDLEDALRAADMALYSAKEAGKSRFQRFDQSMQEKVVSRLQLESNVLQALQRDEYTLYYQPVFDMSRELPGQLVAVEALLRWQQGDDLVPPGDFIPILEESGEIIPVGYWVLEEACRQTRSWHQRGFAELQCSVNLSGLQLREANFVPRLKQILAATGMPPERLVLEITESLLIDHETSTVASLCELADMGIKLALDDFGTGYCSLGYLNRLPLHIVKLDRSFLHEAHLNPRQKVVCRAIIDLARQLSLIVVAEGIETEGHVDLLRAEGCHLGQGYFLARPLPPAALGSLFSGQRNGL